MTYGHWLTRARVHLGDTLDAMAGNGPSGAADILSMTGSRAARSISSSPATGRC